MFDNIEYGEGTRPLCKFTLREPVQLGNVGTVYEIDARLSEDLSRVDVWLVSEQNGRVYWQAVRRRLQDSGIVSFVEEAMKLTKEHTKTSREQNFASNDMLREAVRRIVSEIVYGSLNEGKK